MASCTRKRKAASALEDSTKRLRIEQPIVPDGAGKFIELLGSTLLNGHRRKCLRFRERVQG